MPLRRGLLWRYLTPPDARGGSQASTIPLRTAYRTSAAEDSTRSLRMIAARCVSTVLMLMPNMTAIYLLLFPSAISCTVSRSLGVSVLSSMPERPVT